MLPASPSPVRRMRSPVSTPAGTFTDRVFCSSTRPCPWQEPQGSEIILPVPWQRGQVCWTEKKPCCMRTWPIPPQVVQVTGVVPGLAPLPLQVLQPTRVGTRMVTVVPRTASSRSRSRV